MEPRKTEMEGISQNSIEADRLLFAYPEKCE